MSGFCAGTDPTQILKYRDCFGQQIRISQNYWHTRISKSQICVVGIHNYEDSEDYGDDDGSETSEGAEKADKSGESEDSVDSENYDEFMHYLFLMIP